MGSNNSIRVGSFPYAPGFNPYQQLFTQSLESAGLEVRRIPPTKWFPLSNACREPVDILHLDWHHDWYRGKNAATRLMKSIMYKHGLRQCRRLPVVWTAHNLASHDSTDRSLDYDCTQRLIESCQGIMVMSAAAESLLREHYHVPSSTQTAVIHHGHYIDHYPNEISRDDARAKLGIKPDEFVYLTPGSIRPYKGHLALIDAFAKIGQPADRLVIAGSSSNAGYLAKLQERARPLSHSDHATIDITPSTIVDDQWQDYFKAADVCVLPFQDILNSGSLLLAMSFGKPVVAPRIGSLPEIAHPDTHFGYDPKATNGLVEAMQKARQEADGLTATESIIEFTREKYSWRKVATQLKNFYTDLLSNGPMNTLK